MYWNQQGLPEALRNNLTTGPLEFAGEEAWKARLAELRITNERHVRIATEGTLLGGLIDRGVSPNLVVLSDGALQFVILLHAACWIHAECPLIKMVPHNDEHRTVIETIRGQLRELYKALKTYKLNPDPARKPILEARFDTLVDQRTGYPNVNQVLKSMREMKADLLRVWRILKFPCTTTPRSRTSASSSSVARSAVARGAPAGRRCRDTFASLKKTCRKLEVCFWDYLKDRVAGLGRLPRLADVIRQKAQEAAAKKPTAPSPSGGSEGPPQQPSPCPSNSPPPTDEHGPPTQEGFRIAPPEPPRRVRAPLTIFGKMRSCEAQAEMAEASRLAADADKLGQRGRHAEGVAAAAASPGDSRRQLGAEHVEVATAMNHLADFLNASGKYAEAEPLLPPGAGYPPQGSWARTIPDTAQATTTWPVT